MLRGRGPLPHTTAGALMTANGYYWHELLGWRPRDPLHEARLRVLEGCTPAEREARRQQALQRKEKLRQLQQLKLEAADEASLDGGEAWAWDGTPGRYYAGMFWPADPTLDPYHEAKLRALASRRRVGRAYPVAEQEEADTEEQYALQKEDDAETAALVERFYGDR